MQRVQGAGGDEADALHVGRHRGRRHSQHGVVQRGAVRAARLHRRHMHVWQALSVQLRVCKRASKAGAK